MTDAGLVWVGPPAAAIRQLGSKSAAKALARAHGVPVLPGYDGADQSDGRLAQEAARAGGLAPAIANAANEVAVAAFLEGRLNFPGIARVIEGVLTALPGGPARDLESVLAADAQARRLAQAACGAGAPAAAAGGAS